MVDLKNEDAPAVEAEVSLEYTGDLMAASEADNVMSAVDQVQHKLEQQLRRHKQKRTAHRLSTSGQVAWSDLTEKGYD